MLWPLISLTVKLTPSIEIEPFVVIYFKIFFSTVTNKSHESLTFSRDVTVPNESTCPDTI